MTQKNDTISTQRKCHRENMCHNKKLRNEKKCLHIMKKSIYYAHEDLLDKTC